MFAEATLDYLRYNVSKTWRRFRNTVIDNFRVIRLETFRIRSALRIMD
jgi:hypothetical protein